MREEHLDILCSEDGIENEELMDIAWDGFITSMLRRFVREGIIHPLNEMIDQYVFDGVLASDNSC